MTVYEARLLRGLRSLTSLVALVAVAASGCDDEPLRLPIADGGVASNQEVALCPGHEELAGPGNDPYYWAIGDQLVDDVVLQAPEATLKGCGCGASADIDYPVHAIGYDVTPYACGNNSVTCTDPPALRIGTVATELQVDAQLSLVGGSVLSGCHAAATDSFCEVRVRKNFHRTAQYDAVPRWREHGDGEDWVRTCLGDLAVRRLPLGTGLAVPQLETTLPDAVLDVIEAEVEQLRGGQDPFPEATACISAWAHGAYTRIQESQQSNPCFAYGGAFGPTPQEAEQPFTDCLATFGSQDQCFGPGVWICPLRGGGDCHCELRSSPADTCNGIDDDCDGTIDEGLDDCAPGSPSDRIGSAHAGDVARRHGGTFSDGTPLADRPEQLGIVTGYVLARPPLGEEPPAPAQGCEQPPPGLSWASGVLVGPLGNETLAVATDACGRFELALPALVEAVLAFRRPDRGYFQVQRRVTPDARFPSYEVVVLTPPTEVEINLQTGGLTIVEDQPHNLDSRGHRRAAIWMKPGNVAHLRNAAGQPAGQVRLGAMLQFAEYTRDEYGLAAMPGELPPTTDYTYAAELTLAEARGGTVEFEQPLFVYNLNFIGAGVGQAVPSGYYDRDQARWRPSQNGHVIRLGRDGQDLEVTVYEDDEDPPQVVVSATAANLGDLNDWLDAKLDGLADPTMYHFTADELAELDALYVALRNGQSTVTIWRVPVRHFTPWDFNWPFDCLGDCTPPPLPAPPDEQPKTDCPAQAAGSVIECDNRVLGETIPLAGTPLALTYRSNRSLGYEIGRRLQVVLFEQEGENWASCGAAATAISTFDASISGVTAEVILPDGRKLAKSWTMADIAEGEEAAVECAGNRVLWSVTVEDPPLGVHSVRTNVAYRYLGVYMGTPMRASAAFGARGVGVIIVNPTEPAEVAISRTGRLPLWAVSAADRHHLGGWQLNVVHEYHPSSGTLLRGDGRIERQDGRWLARTWEATSTPSSWEPPAAAMDDAGRVFVHEPNGVVYRLDGPDEPPVHLAVPNSALAPGPVAFVNMGRKGRRLVASDWTNIYFFDVGGEGLIMDGELSHPPMEQGPGFGHLVTSEHCIEGFGRDVRSVLSIAQGATGDIFFTLVGCRAIYRYDPFTKGDSETKGYSIWWSAPIGTTEGRHQIPGSTEDPLYWPTHLSAEGPDLLVTDPLGCRVVRLITGQRPGPEEARPVLHVDRAGDDDCNAAAPHPLVTVSDGAGGLYIAEAMFDRTGVYDENRPDLTYSQYQVVHWRPGLGVQPVASTDSNATLAGTPQFSAASVDAATVLLTMQNTTSLEHPAGVSLPTLIRLSNGRLLASSLEYASVLGRTVERIRWVELSNAIHDPLGYRVPSASGDEAYVFNLTGRHLHTIDNTTGRALWRMSYDGQGRLAQLKNAFGQTFALTYGQDEVTIESQGTPVSDGVQHKLTLDGDRLVTVESADLTYAMTYDQAGLLASFVPPWRSVASIFEYDPLGLLVEDALRDRTTGLETLTNESVRRTTSAGDHVTYTLAQTDWLTTRTVTHRLEDGQHAVDRTTMVEAATGWSLITDPDGNTVETRLADPLEDLECNDLGDTGTCWKRTTTIGEEKHFLWWRVAESAETFDVGDGHRVPMTRTVVSTDGNEKLTSQRTYVTRNEKPYIIETVHAALTGAKATQRLVERAYEIHETAVPQGTSPSLGFPRLVLEHPGAAHATQYRYDEEEAWRPTTIATGPRIGKSFEVTAERIIATSKLEAPQQGAAGGYHVAARGSDFPNLISAKIWLDELGRTVLVEEDDADTLLAYSQDHHQLASLAPPGKEAHKFGHDTLGRAVAYCPPVEIDEVAQPVQQCSATPNSETARYTTLDDDGYPESVEHPHEGAHALTFEYGTATPKRLASIEDAYATHTVGFTYNGPAGNQGEDGRLTAVTWTQPGWTVVVEDPDATANPLAPATRTRIDNGGGLEIVATLTAHRIHANRPGDWRLHALELSPGTGNNPVTIEYVQRDRLPPATVNIKQGENTLATVMLSRDAGDSPYGAVGPPTHITVGTLTWRRKLDNFGEVQLEQVGETNQAPDFEREYLRDALGRITQVTEDGDISARYGYDARGRLTAVNDDQDAALRGYSYDLNGNRTNAQVAAQVTADVDVDHQDRLLLYQRTGGSPFEYEYDGRGTLKRRCKPDCTSPTWEQVFFYDAFGNLEKVTDGSSTLVEYLHDGLGRRIGRKESGGSWTYWTYQDGLEPIAELDDQRRLRKLFVYLHAPNVPTLMVTFDANGDHTGTYMYATDQVGTVRRVFDASTGDALELFDPDEFGFVGEPDAGGLGPTAQPFGFVGGIQDPMTGLVRIGARDYDPHSGRWTAKDPILFGGASANLYVYAGADVVNYLDLDGLLIVWHTQGSRIADPRAITDLAREQLAKNHQLRGHFDEALRRRGAGVTIMDAFNGSKVNVHVYVYGSGGGFAEGYMRWDGKRRLDGTLDRQGSFPGQPDRSIGLRASSCGSPGDREKDLKDAATLLLHELFHWAEGPDTYGGFSPADWDRLPWYRRPRPGNEHPANIINELVDWDLVF